MKHKLVVFSAAGDSAVAEWEETDAKAVDYARGVFEQAQADGYGAVTSTPTGSQRLDTFDPSAEEIVLLRPIAGG